MFSGAGGLALGLERAGFHAEMLNEIAKNACATLRQNRPAWNVKQRDIKSVDFYQYEGQIDLISGGFPCQPFSSVGKKLGFKDERGGLFFEFIRAIAEARPKMFLMENVKGLLNHDNGETLKFMTSSINDAGYEVIGTNILNAVWYDVPQKRERLFIIGVRKDLFNGAQFIWPEPSKNRLTLSDAFRAGKLYPTDVPDSPGQKYSNNRFNVLKHVPPGGCWRDLPKHIQHEYMGAAYYNSGGKTGIARRMSWDEPSLTLLCSPSQKQTERCHPDETRPFTIREYARIQTFPDNWEFCGSIASQYQQIGNAVPVNLAFSVGTAIYKYLRGAHDFKDDKR